MNIFEVALLHVLFGFGGTDVGEEFKAYANILHTAEIKAAMCAHRMSNPELQNNFTLAQRSRGRVR